MFESDYNLKKVIKIKTKGTNIDMYVTPRYVDHYVNKEYEKFSIQIVKQLLNNNNSGCFVDIGAHYGYYSLIANQVLKNNKIISIEPVKENFNILKKNFNLNNIKNSNLICAAASDIDGKSNFVISEASDSSGFSGNPQAKNVKTIKIDTISVAKLLKNEKINLIKIDVEGYEIPIIKDLLKNLNAKDINYLIEFNPKCQSQAGFKPEEILTEFNNANYDTYLIIDDINQLNEKLKTNQKSDISIYKTSNTNQQWSKILNEKACVNLLCIPKNKSKLVTFFSHSSQLGGGERSMLELIKELKDKNIFSHVVLPGEGPLQKELEDISVPYDIVNLNWWAYSEQKSLEDSVTINSNSLTNLINYLPKLSLINPDLIYSNTIVSPWGAIAANYLDKPHIWHIREYGELDHKLKFDDHYPEIINFIEKYSNQIIVNSNSLSNFVNKFLTNKKTQVAYNYIEIEPNSLKEKVKSPYLNKDSLKILISGTIQEGKNQIEAVETVIDMNKKGIECELLLIGAVPNVSYLNKITNIIKKLKAKKYIHILDFVKNPYPYFELSDIVLITSNKEAYGRTAVEGMLLKKVIVASDGGGTKEIIKNGKTGYIYESGNKKELENILATLLDKKLRTKISLNGFNSLKEFNSKEEYGYKIAKIIENTIENYKPTNRLTKITLSILDNQIKTIREKEKIQTESINEINNLTNQIENIDQIISSYQSENQILNKQIKEINEEVSKYESENQNLTKQVEELLQKISIHQNNLNVLTSSKYYKIWRLYCKIKDTVKK